MAPRGTSAAAATNTASPPAAADSQAKRLFDQLDLNHDGMLSLEEFSRATFQQPAAGSQQQPAGSTQQPAK